MRVLELIGGAAVAFVLSVGIYHSLKFLLNKSNANRAEGKGTQKWLK